MRCKKKFFFYLLPVWNERLGKFSVIVGFQDAVLSSDDRKVQNGFQRCAKKIFDIKFNFDVVVKEPMAYK